MWKVEYSKILKEFNEYPNIESIKDDIYRGETDSDEEDDTDLDCDNTNTVLNLGIYSSGSNLKGLLKVLSEPRENIKFIKFQTSKKDRDDQGRCANINRESSVWNHFRHPGLGPIPKLSHRLSTAARYFRVGGQAGYPIRRICNAHTEIDGTTMHHDRYCENPGGESLVLSTFAFKKFIIDDGGWNNDHKIYQKQWEESRFSYNSVYNIFKPIEELDWANVSRNINIVRQEDNFYIKSTSRDRDNVGELSITKEHLSGKLGLTVKIRSPKCGELGDINILEKLKRELPNNGDYIDPEIFKTQLSVPEATSDLGDYIFGFVELDESLSDLCFTNILWSEKPKPGATSMFVKESTSSSRFEGPIQINFKEGKQSASVRIYNTGKIVAVNLPITWNWLNNDLTEIINSENVLNVDKWQSLLRNLKIYNNEIKESDKFYLIDELSFVKSLHGEIYYEGPHSILNLKDAKNIIDNLEFSNIELKNPSVLKNNRLIVNLKKNFVEITIQFYEKNYSVKNDNKAIAQLDISFVKGQYFQNKARLQPNGPEMTEIKNEVENEILSKLFLTEIVEVKEEITDAMRQDFSVPGRIPQKKVTGHPMYPCRTAKERPVPYNFTGKCHTSPWKHMNYPGVKSNVDDRYYPCCSKNISKNIKKNKVALKEGFPRNEEERQLYNLPQSGEIDWHSGVFSNPIIPGQNVDIIDDGEIKNSVIKEVSGKNNVNIKVEVDGSEKDINRLDIVPQNRTFSGLVDIPEDELRSDVKEFCKINKDKCEDIDFGDREEEDIFSKLKISRQNIVPLSAHGFESFTKVPYLAAAVPAGAEETYIWLNSNGIFKVDDNTIKRIDDRCGIDPEIVLHVFEKDDKFYPIDLLYFGEKVLQPYLKFKKPNELDPKCRFNGLIYVWEKCFRDKMEWPWQFLAAPTNPNQVFNPYNLQEHTKNIVDAGYNIMFIPQEGNEPFYSCCPNMFKQTIKMKIIENSVGADDGMVQDIVFEKGRASDGEVWNFRLDVSDMTWKPISQTTGEVTLEEMQREIENVRHPVSKRIFRSIPWKVRFKNRVIEYSLSDPGLNRLQANTIM